MIHDIALAGNRSDAKSLGTASILCNVLLFQVCWFTAVLAGGYWALLPLTVMLGHYLLVMPQSSLLTVCLLALFGILIDSMLLALKVYEFADAPRLPLLELPLWLACLWLAFCLSLPVSLAWLVSKPYYFALGCALFGPLSYLAGRHWLVIDFADHDLVLLVAQWSIFSVLAGLFLHPVLQRTHATVLPQLPGGRDEV